MSSVGMEDETTWTSTQKADDPSMGSEEIRVVEAFTSLTPEPEVGGHRAGGPESKENRWKLAFRQLLFMKRMNMQFNARNKNEIELRQQNISPTSLICSVPHFNGLSAREIRQLVDRCVREKLRPGETLALARTTAQDERFCVIISGAVAYAPQSLESAAALSKAEVFPPMRLAIGDFFAIHAKSNMKVIAMEPVEYLAISAELLQRLNASCWREIVAEESKPTEESSEVESYKQWAQHFALSHHNNEYPVDQHERIAKCTAKAFYKDHFPHISPENELDHTLEYVKGALITAFCADAVRIYAYDRDNQRFLIKFSDEQLSKRFVNDQTCIGKQILETKKSILVIDPAIQSTDDSAKTSSIDQELYAPGSIVLATPFFQFNSERSAGAELETAEIVGFLEIVIESAKLPGDTPTQISLNDASILELTSQELGRYLYFHYDEFFVVQSCFQTVEPQHTATTTDSEPHTVHAGDVSEAESIDLTQLFPSPDVTPENDKRHLVVSVNALQARIADPVAHLDIQILLGNTCLSNHVVEVALRRSSFMGPLTDKASGSGTAKMTERQRDLELKLPLADIPHGSHLRVILLNKTNEAVAWTGLHLFDFGHSLRSGDFRLDIVKAFSSSKIITSLDIENCSKLNRPGTDNIVGSIEILLECSGSSSHAFSFSSLADKKRKQSMAYRASIFHNSMTSSVRTTTAPLLHTMESLNKISAKRQALLKKLRKDPVTDISDEERNFIWNSRTMLSEDSALLSTFLASVNWGRRDQVMEAYKLLQSWTQPTYLEALQLLSPKFADPKVRAYAVRCMDALPDYRLQLYMPQLVQALKNERYHDSALARFLLMRSLLNPAQIGYSLYWSLRADVHNPQTNARFSLIMDQYLLLCGSYKLEIRQSVYVMKKLEEIAAAVKHESTQATQKESKSRLRTMLSEAVLPETFQLPMNPRTYWSKIIAENCRVMSSKKKPLLLELASAKAQHGTSRIIFKAGDDLRQDQLVLQILRVMDDLWHESGLELCMLPYACLSTGNELGLIEVVEDSETLASIIYKRHDKSSTKLGRKLKSATDALVKDGVISDWLFQNMDIPSKDDKRPSGASTDEFALGSLAHSNSSSPVRPAERPRSMSACFPPLSPTRMLGLSRKPRSASDTYERDSSITDTFVRSCAGYCVATYVLGVGDRHNDNIMLQRSGKLFHIDFGHFLGNFKSKLGVKRERAPFVFTPSMLDAMGGRKSEAYQQFKRLACDAFQVLRDHSNLLITLLVLALTCDIPELTGIDDVAWVHKTLMLDVSDEEAERRFKKLIHVALHTKTTKLNDAVHLMAH